LRAGLLGRERGSAASRICRLPLGNGKVHRRTGFEGPKEGVKV